MEKKTKYEEPHKTRGKTLVVGSKKPRKCSNHPSFLYLQQEPMCLINPYAIILHLFNSKTMATPWNTQRTTTILTISVFLIFCCASSSEAEPVGYGYTVSTVNSYPITNSLIANLNLIKSSNVLGPDIPQLSLSAR